MAVVEAAKSDNMQSSPTLLVRPQMQHAPPHSGWTPATPSSDTSSTTGRSLESSDIFAGLEKQKSDLLQQPNKTACPPSNTDDLLTTMQLDSWPQIEDTQEDVEAIVQQRLGAKRGTKPSAFRIHIQRMRLDEDEQYHEAQRRFQGILEKRLSPFFNMRLRLDDIAKRLDHFIGLFARGIDRPPSPNGDDIAFAVRERLMQNGVNFSQLVLSPSSPNKDRLKGQSAIEILLTGKSTADAGPTLSELLRRSAETVQLPAWLLHSIPANDVEARRRAVRQSATMPHDINLLPILQNVSKALEQATAANGSSGLGTVPHELWRQIFLCEQNMQLFIVCFWWIILCQFRSREEYTRAKPILFERMAHYYARLFPPAANQHLHYKNIHHLFPNALAHAIYMALNECFPGSRHLFLQENFKELLNERLYNLFIGRMASYSDQLIGQWKKWRVNYAKADTCKNVQELLDSHASKEGTKNTNKPEFTMKNFLRRVDNAAKRRTSLNVLDPNKVRHNKYMHGYRRGAISGASPTDDQPSPVAEQKKVMRSAQYRDIKDVRSKIDACKFVRPVSSPVRKRAPIVRYLLDLHQTSFLINHLMQQKMSPSLLAASDKPAETPSAADNVDGRTLTKRQFVTLTRRARRTLVSNEKGQSKQNGQSADGEPSPEMLSEVTYDDVKQAAKSKFDEAHAQIQAIVAKCRRKHDESWQTTQILHALDVAKNELSTTPLDRKKALADSIVDFRANMMSMPLFYRQMAERGEVVNSLDPMTVLYLLGKDKQLKAKMRERKREKMAKQFAMGPAKKTASLSQSSNIQLT